MTLAVKQPNPSHVRLLVLTPEYADFLWLGALLSRDCEMEPDLTWCPDLIDCDDLIRNTHFDVILWDCVFHGGSEDAFLQYLSVSSNEKPVLALSAEPASERAVDLLANGASDYLSRQSLEEWGCAERYAVFGTGSSFRSPLTASWAGKWPVVLSTVTCSSIACNRHC